MDTDVASKEASNAAKTLLRELLLKHGIADVLIKKMDSGKPFLPAYPEWHISLSHSPKHVAAAVCTHPVGIDIEHCQREAPWLRLARRYCSADEQQWIANQPDPRQAFLQTWTAKEAYVKASGTGLRLKINQVEALHGKVHGEAVTHTSQLHSTMLDESYISICVLSDEPAKFVHVETTS